VCWRGARGVRALLLRLVRGRGQVLQYPLPLVSHLLVDDGMLFVDCARCVLFDHAVEEFVHDVGSAPES
jgi:hypothetical protein